MSLIPAFPQIDTGFIQVLDREGTIVRKDLIPQWSDTELRHAYETMILLRRADRKFLALQRSGRCGTYPSMEGQEACQMGAILAIQKNDLIFPAFRELGACFMHGVPLEKIYLYWMGDEWGSNFEANVAPVSIPVGSHPLHAVGAAWAFRLQKKPLITVSFFSDGATSEGDLYEALNFATMVRAPTIFFCQNNQWAISTPVSKQTVTPTLAQKAIAAQMRHVRVDGNDLFACVAVMKEAAKIARSNEPVFIEAITYRLGAHTSSDDTKKYRSGDEEAVWRKKDPILRFQKYLSAQKLWTPEFAKQCEIDADAAISHAVEIAENTKQKSEDIFNYMYEKNTPELIEQKKNFLEG